MSYRLPNSRKSNFATEPRGDLAPHRYIEQIGPYLKQHLDNLRRKDSLRGAETTEVSVRLGSYSASHFEGSALSILTDPFSSKAVRIRPKAAVVRVRPRLPFAGAGADAFAIERIATVLTLD